jgi:hypothetical protein
MKMRKMGTYTGGPRDPSTPISNLEMLEERVTPLTLKSDYHRVEVSLPTILTLLTLLTL